jgi:hypothetical protein
VGGVAGNFGDNPLQIENARLRLAEAVLSITTEEQPMSRRSRLVRCKRWLWTTNLASDRTRNISN